MTGPGGINDGAFRIPWRLLVISGIAEVAIILILGRSERLRTWMGGAINRLLDSKRKDNNWGKWMP